MSDRIEVVGTLSDDDGEGAKRAEFFRRYRSRVAAILATQYGIGGEDELASIANLVTWRLGYILGLDCLPLTQRQLHAHVTAAMATSSELTYPRLRPMSTGTTLLVEPSPPSPPHWAEYLTYFLPREQRQYFRDDLDEEYGEIHEKFGRRRADFWYACQVVTSFGALVPNWLRKLIVDDLFRRLVG